jgi:hypothetical protein
MACRRHRFKIERAAVARIPGWEASPITSLRGNRRGARAMPMIQDFHPCHVTALAFGFGGLHISLYPGASRAGLVPAIAALNPWANHQITCSFGNVVEGNRKVTSGPVGLRPPVQRESPGVGRGSVMNNQPVPAASSEPPPVMPRTASVLTSCGHDAARPVVGQAAGPVPGLRYPGTGERPRHHPPRGSWRRRGRSTSAATPTRSRRSSTR